MKILLEFKEFLKEYKVIKEEKVTKNKIIFQNLSYT